LRFFQNLFRVFDELQIQAGALGGIGEFDGEKQIAHNGQNSLGFLIRHINDTVLVTAYAAFPMVAAPGGT
jgi:hypothetical protein